MNSFGWLASEYLPRLCGLICGVGVIKYCTLVLKQLTCEVLHSVCLCVCVYVLLYALCLWPPQEKFASESAANSLERMRTPRRRRRRPTTTLRPLKRCAKVHTYFSQFAQRATKNWFYNVVTWWWWWWLWRVAIARLCGGRATFALLRAIRTVKFSLSFGLIQRKIKSRPFSYCKTHLHVHFLFKFKHVLFFFHSQLEQNISFSGFLNALGIFYHVKRYRERDRRILLRARER